MNTSDKQTFDLYKQCMTTRKSWTHQEKQRKCKMNSRNRAKFSKKFDLKQCTIPDKKEVRQYFNDAINHDCMSSYNKLSYALHVNRTKKVSEMTGEELAQFKSDVVNKYMKFKNDENKNLVFSALKNRVGLNQDDLYLATKELVHKYNNSDESNKQLCLEKLAMLFKTTEELVLQVAEDFIKNKQNEYRMTTIKKIVRQSTKKGKVYQTSNTTRIVKSGLSNKNFLVLAKLSKLYTNEQFDELMKLKKTSPTFRKYKDITLRKVVNMLAEQRKTTKNNLEKENMMSVSNDQVDDNDVDEVLDE